MAFRFVDRISTLEPGKRAVGHFEVPPDGPLVPFLTAEAVGQLAGWVAIAARDFTRRPVAAIAGRASFKRLAHAGSAVDLEVHVDSVDDSAVTYSGQASCQGETILSLERCLGPMMPIEEFEDPAECRATFARLCGEGERAGGLEGPVGIECSPLPPIKEKPRWRMALPGEARFLADHFPRKPVIPGTLFLEAQMGLAVRHAAEVLEKPLQDLRVMKVQDVKLRRFLDPGDVVELEIAVRSRDAESLAVRLTTVRDGTKISTANAEVVLRRRP